MERFDLPLFPLSTVLVPSMTLPLHIFEPRYRCMIAACLGGDRRFGVVLSRDGEDVGETASACAVGTVAEIVSSDRLADGRLNLITEGRGRFEILRRFSDLSYLHATVRMLDEPLGIVENAVPLARETRILTERYLHMLLQQAQQDDLVIDLPEEPVDLSYHFANLWQQIHPVSLPEMQALLEAESAEARLRQEVGILRREFAILQRIARLAAAGADTGGTFNPN